jgi:hypothetical protein
VAEATARDSIGRAGHGPRRSATPLAWTPLLCALLSVRCDNPYPIAPTACDDYCWVTQRAGCEEDYPEGCVSDCEDRALARRWPRCEPHWLELIECYRRAPDSAFQCIDDESRPLPVCVDERVALGACMAPERGPCLEVCFREAVECGDLARRCEARCRSTPPGCEDRELALYKCQLNEPVDCVDPAMETRDVSEIPCIAEIGALLECADS